MAKEKITVNKNLKELHSSGYEVRDGEPDIRGWKMRTVGNLEIGKVKELLFDTVSLRVRYLVVALNGKPLNLLSRNIIIPIGLAELGEKDNYVLFPQVTVAHYASLPKYKKGEVAIETERAIRTVFAPTQGVTYKDPDYNDPEFYDNEYFDDERMYRNRRPLYPTDNDLVDEERGERLYRRFVPSHREKEISEENIILERPVIEKEDLSHPRFQDNPPFSKRINESKGHSGASEIYIDEEVRERDERINDPGKTAIDVEKLNKEDLPDD